MSDLLPSNATTQERALAETIARISDVPVVIRQIWNPDTCPISALPWLAWAFSVDDWDTNWTDNQKRQVVKASIASHRIKGTIGAVKKNLSALGYDITILEWFQKETPGDPYTFDVFINSSQYPLTVSDYNKVLDVINTNKNLRSHMGDIQIIVKSETVSFNAAVSALGSEISVTNYGYIPSVVNDYVLAINEIRV